MINRKGETLLASTSITSATTTTLREIVANYQAAYILIDVTARAASQTLTMSIEIYDPASATWMTLSTAAVALGATGDYIYLIGQSTGFTGDEEEVFNMPLPRKWRVSLVTATADNITFSVGLLPLGR